MGGVDLKQGVDTGDGEAGHQLPGGQALELGAEVRY